MSNSNRPVVLSLYDFSTTMVQPWAEAGYECICYDIDHEPGRATTIYPLLGGSIQRVKADLQKLDTILAIIGRWKDRNVAMVFGFPVCTDLAVSGARHFKAKAAIDPDFQTKAAHHAQMVAYVANRLGAPYMVENPVSVLATIWRKPNYIFNPCDYGRYIPEHHEAHPVYPDLIPPRDAYKKRTCLWTSGPLSAFTMPTPAPVEPVGHSYNLKDGGTTTSSSLYGKLGGKSARTKRIRSMTPRGFAQAVFIANDQDWFW